MVGLKKTGGGRNGHRPITTKVEKTGKRGDNPRDSGRESGGLEAKGVKQKRRRTREKRGGGGPQKVRGKATDFGNLPGRTGSCEKNSGGKKERRSNLWVG